MSFDIKIEAEVIAIVVNQMRMIPHKLRYLNTWSSVSGTVWEGLGGVDLLEEVSQ